MEYRSNPPTAGDARPISPAALLPLAFCDHDFGIDYEGHSLHIQSFEGSHEGDAVYVEVNAIDWSREDEEGAVTYRYRIEHVPD